MCSTERINFLTESAAFAGWQAACAAEYEVIFMVGLIAFAALQPKISYDLHGMVSPSMNYTSSH